MSDRYQVFHLFPQSRPFLEVATTLHGALLEAGGVLDADCLFHVDDDAGTDPEPVGTFDEVATRLQRSRRLGLLEYFFEGAFISVTYLNEAPGRDVSSVRISVPQRAFERGGSEFEQAMIALVSRLHQELRPMRTIMDWGLESGGFSWVEELQRLRVGVMGGTYRLFDAAGEPGVADAPP